MSDKRVVCIGNMTHDTLLRVNDIPELDDVAYVNENVECMGGRGAIVAIALGRLGISTDLITSLPSNELTDKYIELLNENNVETKNIFIDDKANKLFEVVVAISKEQSNCISFFKPSDIKFEANQKQKEKVRAADMAYFSTHKRSFNQELLNEIDPQKTQIIHNVSSYFLQSEEYVKLMLEKSSVLVFNELEAKKLLENIRELSAETIFKSAPNLDTIFMTCGESGSMIYEKTGKVTHVEAKMATEVISPVGAGDTYAAGIVYGIANGWDNELSARFASEIACLSVESETSYPNLEKLDDLTLECGEMDI
ncbi:MAG: carbohydrate kinase family protein [Clostridia bacterium]|nr:carbohydrate kinase family protein [Clostridia bacterium]